MKSLIVQIFVISVLVFVLFSCKKEAEETPVVVKKDIENLSVPVDFDYKTGKTVSVKFATTYDEPYAVVEVYNGDPNRGGSIIIAGKLENKKFEKDVVLPSYVDHLFIRLKKNNGISKYFDVNIDDNLAEYNYDPSVQTRSVNAIETYDCDANCTQTISESGTYNNVSVNEGETLCISEGVTVSGSINVNGGTLSVCGTVNATVNLNGTSPTIIIGETGSISISNFNSNVRIINYKDNFILPSTINGYFENHANINISGNLTINSGGEMLNYGDVNISGTLMNNGEIVNESQLDVIVFTQNSSGKLTNNCHFAVEANLTQMSSFFINNSYLSVGAILQINSGAKLELAENAFVNCNYFRVWGTIENDGNDYARIEVGSECSLYSTSIITGLIDICDNDGIELSDGNIGFWVKYCQTAIPATECNPGIGDLVTSDGDDDGIIDMMDFFPSDPDRAFVSYFPEKGDGTFAFEDLWPYKGDYDFNDLVVKYRYKIFSNAAGFVKEIEYTFKLVAVGGSFKNGFGIEFPVDAYLVEDNTEPVNLTEGIINLTSKNIESNQSKAVAIIFDNGITTLSYPGGGVTGINTNNGAPYSEPKTIVGTITFITSQNIMASLPFNPFMIVNLERGKEVHLRGSLPTDLANTSYFNTGNDASGNGVYYKTKDNLPWALNIMSDFDYPIEKAEITQAHLKFFEWASSAGVNFPDWYLNLSNYRNEDYIFTP